MMGEGLETEWLSIHDGKDRVTNLPQAAGSVLWVVVAAWVPETVQSPL